MKGLRKASEQEIQNYETSNFYPKQYEISAGEMKELLTKIENFYISIGNPKMNIIWLANMIIRRLKNDRDYYINCEGEKGSGKSNLMLLLALMVCRYAGLWRNRNSGRVVRTLPRELPLSPLWEQLTVNFSFDNNMSFLDNVDDVTKKFNSLDKFQPFIIDEGSKNLHKYQWQSKLQFKLIQLSDSVSKNAEILFYNKNQLLMDTIENMYKKYGDKPKDIKVYTISDNFNTILKPLKYILKRKVRKDMYEVITSLGKQTIVTSDHSLFILKNNKLEAIPTNEIKIGDYIASPLYLPSLTNIKKNNDLMYFYGAWIADGSYNKIWGVNLSGKEHFRIAKKIAKLYNCKYRISKNNVDICLQSKKLCLEMKKIGFVGNSYTKAVPNWIFNTTLKNKINFLKGLFTGDGSISKYGEATYCSIQKSLVKQVQTLCHMCGMPSSYLQENKQNNYNGKKSGTYTNRITIPAQFAMKTIKLFETTKTNYKILLNHKIQYPNKNGKIINNSICLRVKKIKKIKYNDYVYDFEVKDIHRFIANDLLHENTERWQNKAFFVCFPNFKELNTVFRNDRIRMRLFVYARHTTQGYASCIISLRDVNRWIMDPWHMDDNARSFEELLKRVPAAMRNYKHILYAEKKLKGYAGNFEFPSIQEMSPRIWGIYMKYKLDNAKKELETEDVKESRTVIKWKFATKTLIAWVKQHYPEYTWDDFRKLTHVSNATLSKLWKEKLDVEEVLSFREKVAKQAEEIAESIKKPIENFQVDNI
jgi:intein/homing endonuclease